MRVGTAGLADDGEPECGIGRGENRSDQQCRRERKLRKDQLRDHAADRDRQQQPDPEQPADETGVATEASEVHRRCIGEQHERQRDLGQQFNGLRFDLEVEDREHVGSEDKPDDHEYDGRSQRHTVETIGDQGIAREKQNKDSDPGFHPASSSDR